LTDYSGCVIDTHTNQLQFVFPSLKMLIDPNPLDLHMFFVFMLAILFKLFITIGTHITRLSFSDALLEDGFHKLIGVDSALFS
jgi:hypothetical protein